MIAELWNELNSQAGFSQFFGTVVCLVILAAIVVIRSKMIGKWFDARLTSATGPRKDVRILDDFNNKLDGIVEKLEAIATDAGRQPDLITYLLDDSWLDFAQLLYALHRGRSVLDGVTAL